MSTANPRIRHPLSVGLALLVLAVASASVPAQDIDPAIGPVWSAGGHYTAELDLGALELKLLPLSGLDARLGLRELCPPGRHLESGVYVLQVEGQTRVLHRTHPNGTPPSLGSDRVPLAACEDPTAPRDALKLPQLALLAMEQAAVGAVYVHP